MLFVCDECHAIENTALAQFYGQQQSADARVLCTACGPDKKWHGMFEKRVATADELRSRRCSFKKTNGYDWVLSAVSDPVPPQDKEGST